MLDSLPDRLPGVRNRRLNRRQPEQSVVDVSRVNGQNQGKSVFWRSGREVEGSGFENRRGGNSTRGSNPFFSAK
jgi:hypothetical protein